MWNAKTRTRFTPKETIYCGTTKAVSTSIPNCRKCSGIITNSDIPCNSKCPFCNTTLGCLRQWLKHFDKCKLQKKGLSQEQQSEADRVKRDLCWSASEKLDKQLKARAALEEIQEQVKEEDGDWEDGGDASGGVSINLLGFHLMWNYYTESANLVYGRPRKRQRTERGSRCHPQSPPQSMSESETDPSGMNRQRLQASGTEF
jgi:ubiquitin